MSRKQILFSLSAVVDNPSTSYMTASHDYDMRAVEEADPFPNNFNLMSETPFGSVTNTQTQ